MHNQIEPEDLPAFYRLIAAAEPDGPVALQLSQLEDATQDELAALSDVDALRLILVAGQAAREIMLIHGLSRDTAEQLSNSFASMLATQLAEQQAG
jgi:hypothetical protein